MDDANSRDGEEMVADKKNEDYIKRAKLRLNYLLDSGKIDGAEYNKRIIAMEVPSDTTIKHQVPKKTKKATLIHLSILLIIAITPAAIFLNWRFYFQNTLTTKDMPDYSNFYTSSLNDEPVQVNIDSYRESGEYKGREIDVAYKYYYDLSGIVTSVHDYWGLGDYETLVPRDVCVVWGELSNLYLSGGAEFHQAERHCLGKVVGGELGPAETFTFRTPFGQTRTSISSMSNNHLIPSTPEIRSKIFELRAGDKVRITGYLVNVRYGGISLNSSTTREDSGNGACEVIYVTGIEKQPTY